MSPNLWLYDQIDAAFSHLCFELLIVILFAVFLFGLAVLIGEGIFIIWLTMRGIVRWIRRFPSELRKCLTYHHCSIPGCKGRHVSHI